MLACLAHLSVRGQFPRLGSSCSRCKQWEQQKSYLVSNFKQYFYI